MYCPAGFGEDLTGLEVAHSFDLNVTYYPRISPSACKQLCLDTPGCRSIGFSGIHHKCVLKTATCFEAGLGIGCTQWSNGPDYILQADRLTANGFVVSSPRVPFHFAVPNQRVPYRALANACDQMGLYPAFMVQADAVRGLQRAAEAFLAAFDQRGASATYWLGATHDATSNEIVWADPATRGYGSPADDGVALNVTWAGGCLALLGRNGSMSLVVQPCNASSYPVCGYSSLGKDVMLLAAACGCERSTFAWLVAHSA